MASARAWLGTLASNGLILACGIAAGVLSARLLLPEGRGALAAILFWPQLIAGIGICSLQEAVTCRISQGTADRDRVVATAFWLALLLAGGVSLLTYFLLPELLGAERSDWVELARNYSLWFLPANFVGLVLLGGDHGELRFGRYNGLRLLVPLTYLVGLLGLWWLDAVTVTQVIWINLLATLLVTVIRIGLARRRLVGIPSWTEARRLLATGWRIHLTVLLFVLGSQIDRLLVVTFWDDTAVGLYAAAYTFASAGLGLIAQTFHTVLFPGIARRGTREAQRDFLAKGLRHAMLLLVLCTLLLAVSVPWLIPRLFGAPFATAQTPALLLLCAYLPMALRQIAVRGLRGIGDTMPGTVAEALALGVFLPAAWWLRTHAGLSGICIALLIANGASLLYLMAHLERRYRLAPASWWGLNGETVREMVRTGHRLIVHRVAAQ